MKIATIKFSMFLLFIFSTSIAFSQVKVGMKAPDIILNDTNGNEMKLSNFKGKLVLVDFWASWCAPCRKANPDLEALFQKYKDKGFVVVGVSLDSKKESWLNAIKKDKITYPQLNDTAFWNSKVAVSYGVEALSSSFLIDKEGIIKVINPSEIELNEIIEQNILF